MSSHAPNDSVPVTQRFEKHLQETLLRGETFIKLHHDAFGVFSVSPELTPPAPALTFGLPRRCPLACPGVVLWPAPALTFGLPRR